MQAVRLFRQRARERAAKHPERRDLRTAPRCLALAAGAFFLIARLRMAAADDLPWSNARQPLGQRLTSRESREGQVGCRFC
jgi:hypothetical protein